MNQALSIGIHDICFATTHYAIDLTVLADHHGVDPGKYQIGLGQDTMSVPASNEDIVTMAAAAASPILDRHGTDNLRTVLLATETGVDQAKAAGLYLHPLLDLPTTCRIVELKQACYSSTAALQLAAALVNQNSTEQVLVIATDIARYDLDTPAEPTQGAAAVAMLIAADPAILRLDSMSGLFSADVMDFWRPNYRTTAIVAGKLSIDAYLMATSNAWADYRHRGGRDPEEIAAFCYHLPFSAMARKAHRHLLASCGIGWDAKRIDAAVRDSTIYNRLIGNSYTASLYVGFASLLDSGKDLTDQAIAFLSYGSGCVSESFSGLIQPGYRTHLRTTTHHDVLAVRELISYNDYRELHTAYDSAVGTRHSPPGINGQYRFESTVDNVRIYRGARTKKSACT
ncbi:hydroxymethylglutaryl-CoA synthase [Nocardia brasiliensis]|uniref:hydroxymethylglutaryl-CoA synthase n=1 Tax=Nocardia brasiliensis TaxID=37326 RepID=UPI002455D725|nr:hydroxymethylglutaryl-CoA synthase [Nocardia brasiliensis]